MIIFHLCWIFKVKFGIMSLSKFILYYSTVINVNQSELNFIHKLIINWKYEKLNMVTSPQEENKIWYFLGTILIKIHYLQTTSTEPASQVKFFCVCMFIAVRWMTCRQSKFNLTIVRKLIKNCYYSWQTGINLIYIL